MGTQILNSPGLFQLKASPGSQKSNRAIISVKIGGVGSSSFSVVVTACSGGLQVNHQNVQDFQGNNFLTVFGRSVNDFVLSCAEASSCSGSKNIGLVNIANAIKNATSTGKIPTVTIAYNGLSIKGALIGITFELDHPYQTFDLHVIGTQV